MPILARLECHQDPDQRVAARRTLRLDAILAGSGEAVVIHNLSVSGFLIETSADFTSGETLEIELPEGGPTPASVVWNRGRFYGCEFAVRVPAAVISAAVLRDPIAPAPAVSDVEAALSEDQREEVGKEVIYTFSDKALLISVLSTALWVVIVLAAISLI